MNIIPHKQWNKVLGMNARTISYIKKNPKKAARIANRKLETKKALQKAGIGTPRLFAVIRNRSELRSFRWTKLPASFVLKPNNSSGGGGIQVIYGRNKKGNWVKSDKSEVFIDQLHNQVVDILDGNFSKGNVPDVAFFEQRVKVHGDLKQVSVKGVPDIRVLVYNTVPVMAMLRLATQESAGRANLHAGGVGVGIDLAVGITTTAIHKGHIIETHPDKRIDLSGIRIPHWNQILNMASEAARAIDLQYAGIDITIDKEDGPMVLEVNARPGLEIQVANLTPLKSRLRRLEELEIKSSKKAVQLAKSLFGIDVEQEIEDVTGRTVLGIEEEITIQDSEGEEHVIHAKVDTGAYRTTIDEQLAKKLNLHTPIVEYKSVRGALGRQTRPVVDVKLMVRNHPVKTQAFLADRSHMNYDMILGRRDMKGFLVDPAKRLNKSK